MKTVFAHRSPQRRRGFTLVELLVASSIGLLLGGGAALLIVEAAKENARSVADMMVEEAASNLEGRLLKYLRSMSAREGAVYATPTEDPADGYRGYQRLIVAQGPAPDFPREELRFEPDTGRAIYIPDRNQPDSRQVLMHSHSNMVVLRNLCFFPSVKADSTPDNSLVNVVIEMDDNGYGRRKAQPNFARVQRTFCVKMRNN